jgi:hypothetical protein
MPGLREASVCATDYLKICAHVHQIASDLLSFFAKHLLNTPELFGVQELVSTLMQTDLEPTHFRKSGKPRLREP